MVTNHPGLPGLRGPLGGGSFKAKTGTVGHPRWYSSCNSTLPPSQQVTQKPQLPTEVYHLQDLILSLCSLVFYMAKIFA